MKNIIICIAFIGLIMEMMSCAYNIEEELYPQEMCDTTNVTYQADIVPILTQNCYECHSGSAPISGILLEGHSNLKVIADAGRLVGAVRHLTNFSPMPKDRPSLPECDLLKIENWVAQGSPDN
jgi:hypothetical protein